MILFPPEYLGSLACSFKKRQYRHTSRDLLQTVHLHRKLSKMLANCGGLLCSLCNPPPPQMPLLGMWRAAAHAIASSLNGYFKDQKRETVPQRHTFRMVSMQQYQAAWTDNPPELCLQAKYNPQPQMINEGSECRRGHAQMNGLPS